jgi:hypothetical protein
MKQAQRDGKMATMIRDKLFIDGERYMPINEMVNPIIFNTLLTFVQLTFLLSILMSLSEILQVLQFVSFRLLGLACSPRIPMDGKMATTTRDKLFIDGERYMSINEMVNHPPQTQDRAGKHSVENRIQMIM